MKMHPEAEQRFLEEGARSYVAAVNAISAFRALVVERCRKVVEGRLCEPSRRDHDRRID